MSSCICIVTGRLTRDVELSTIPSGTAVANFGIAYETGWGDNKKPSFVDCVAWGKTAEFIAQYFGKGKPIYIEASLEQDHWEDKQTMQKRSKHKFNVSAARFLDQDSKQEPVVLADQPAVDPFSSGSSDEVPF